MDLTPIEIGLTTAIVAVNDDEPRVLVAEGGKKDKPAGLPSGAVRSALAPHLRNRLARLGAAQTALNVAYVEQLYTFGDRGRHARVGDTDPHVVSIGYLALTRMPDNVAALRARRELSSRGTGSFRGRTGATAARQSSTTRSCPPLKTGRARTRRPFAAERLRLCFGVERHRAGTRRRCSSATSCSTMPALSRKPGATAAWPRRPAARPIHALRSPPHSRDRHRAPARQIEIPPRRVRIDAGGIHAHRIAAHGGGDFRPASAQAEFPPAGGDHGPGRADRRNVDRDRRPAGRALPLPPRGHARAACAGPAARCAS